MATKKFADRLASKKAQLSEKIKSPVAASTEAASSASEEGSRVEVSSTSLASSASVPEDKPRAGRDYNAVIVDVRKLNVEAQIRDKYAEDPKAMSPESIAALAALIRSSNDGKFEQPISIQKTGDSDLLIEGARRVLAAKHNADTTGDEEHFFQPARYRRSADNEDRDFLQFALNNSKEAVDLEATVRFFNAKLKQGMSQADIAEKSGYSKAKVSRLLAISDYPESIQKLIFAGELAYTGPTLKRALKEAKRQERAPDSTPSAPEPGSEDLQGEFTQHPETETEPMTGHSGYPESNDDQQKTDKASRAILEATQKPKKISIDRDQAVLLARQLARLNKSLGIDAQISKEPSNGQILALFATVVEQDTLGQILEGLKDKG